MATAVGHEDTGGGERRSPSFDDWAMRLSGAVLVWICAYFLFYLLSDAWLGDERQVRNVKRTVFFFGLVRTGVYVVDLVRGRGTWLTRHPGLAFFDMLCLGALVMESWDQHQDSSLLAPMFLVFLALVPILYRGIADRRLYVAFAVLLAIEASLLIVPQSLIHLSRRYTLFQETLEAREARQRTLASMTPIVVPPPGESFLSYLVAMPEGAALTPAVAFGTRLEERVREAEVASDQSMAAVRHTSADLEAAVRAREISRQELESDLGLVRENLARLPELREGAKRLPLESLEAEAQRRLTYVASLMAQAERALEAAWLDLEIAYLRKLTDPRRALVDNLAIWLNIVLGLLVQFQVRRFVTRRIETERSRTLSEMLSERHRMDAQNWINLTAGLTHNIGNEVRGYDVFLEEILEWMAREGVPAPPEIREKLEFIYRTNQARLGFIQFLREFALLKQVFEDERPTPRGLQSIPLAAAITAAHGRVREIETSYNPADSTDPGDVRKRRKFLETPLEIHSSSAKPVVLARGREAVLDFFFYELIKNALRNCSGKQPLVVLIQRVPADGTVEISFINDLAVEARPGGVCSRCQRDSGADPLVIYSVHGKQPLCVDCLRERVEETLEGCFHPGRGSGTGLGLFVIRHFLEEYYNGLIHCGIEAWQPQRLCFMVYFRLVVPDDLGQAIRKKNAAWSA